VPLAEAGVTRAQQTRAPETLHFVKARGARKRLALTERPER